MHRLKKISILLSLILIIGVVFGSAAFSFANEEPENSVNLTVGENIISHYYLDASAYESKGASKYRYSYNNGNTQEKTEIVSDIETFEGNMNSQGKIQINIAQAAAQIAEPITVEILDEDENKIDKIEYTAKEYCNNIISMNDSALLSYTSHPSDLKKLCKAIVTYSKSAQGVFSSYMEKEGSVAITDDYSSELNLDEAEYDYSGYTKINGNIQYKSVSFMCESTAKMRFYFVPVNANDSTDYGDPVVSSPFESSWSKGVDPDGKYSLFIQINDIAPVNFDKPIEISYAGATIKMSVLEYAGVVIANEGTSAELKTLGKSLIRYNETAKDFFNAPATVYVPAKASTCTEAGCIAHYELGGKSYSDADATEEIDASLPLIAHSYGEYVQTASPTCTNTGTETRTCSVCGAVDSRDIASLGHSYDSNVTAPTCTVQGYTTYTCSGCGESYVSDYVDATGHSYGAWSVTNGATLTSTGTETRTCANNSSHTEIRTIPMFTCKFVNRNDYLYRVGNGNNVKLSSLFASENGADITSVTATVSNNSGNASGTFTNNNSDWRESTLKFSGTGVVTVSLKHGTYTAATLKLEVVTGNNITSATTVSSAATSAVMLNDISITGAWNVSTGTLYGNGFTIDATGTAPNGTTVIGNLSGAINLTNGTLNNVKVIGPNFNNAAMYQGNANNVFTVKTSGVCYIYNSYIFGSRATIGLYGASATADVTIENTVLDGGRYCNIFHRFGKLNLHNVTTISQPRETIGGNMRCGFGIVISDEASANEIITATGYLKQYNWVGKNTDVNYFKGDNNDSTDADTVIPNLFSNMFSKASSLTVSYNGDTYINTGILSLGSAAQATGSALSSYTSKSVSLVNTTGWVMAPTSLDAENDFKYYSSTSYSPSTQTPTVPTFTWSYPSTYSSTEKKVTLSYDQGSDGVSFNPNILTASKYNNNLNIGVSMNNTDYTGKSITFNTAGNYQIVYTITDTYNYAADGIATSTRTYTKTLDVTVNEKVASISAPEFTYYNTSGTALKTSIVDIGGKHYVTVDSSETNTSTSTVKSITASGTTVKYPVVTVQFKDNSSDFNYLFPIFTGVNIKNYTNASGSSTTYSKSSNLSALPSGLEMVTADPNWNGKSSFKSYEKNSTYGLIAKSDAIGSTQSARNCTIQFKFTAGNGEDYYYYIYYDAAAHNKPSGGGCVAEGSQVTMADGTKKAVEDVKPGDMVLTWSMWEGKFEAQPVIKNMYHGTEDWDVLTLNFSNGSSSRTVIDHGFYDADKNNYVYINTDNVESYIGDTFVVQNVNGDMEKVRLTDYTVTVENVGIYNVISAYNINCFIDDVLTISPEVYAPGLFEYFNIGDDMVFDKAQIAEEIDEYGFYDYSQFSEYVSEEAFDMLNLKYYKIFVERGDVDYDALIKMIVTYICD